jgi:hypothetical protein
MYRVWLIHNFGKVYEKELIQSWKTHYWRWRGAERSVAELECVEEECSECNEGRE